MQQIVNSAKTENYDYVAKVVLVGDSSVGKSNLLARFTTNTFSDEIKPTLGVEFGTKLVSIKTKSKNEKAEDLIKLIKVQIWDTAGQEKYRSITNSYYLNTKGVLLVFDLSRKSSFDSVDRWLNEVHSITGENISIILVGNKSDLTIEREVNLEDIEEKIKKYNLLYQETSALNGNNVNETFISLTELIYNNYLCKINADDDEDFKKSSIDVNEKNNNSSKCGC